MTYFSLTDYAGNFGCQIKAQANGTRCPQASFQAGTDKQWKARTPITRFVYDSLLKVLFLLEDVEGPNEDFQIRLTEYALYSHQRGQTDTLLVPPKNTMLLVPLFFHPLVLN